MDEEVDEDEVGDSSVNGVIFISLANEQPDNNMIPARAVLNIFNVFTIVPSP
jgi:hypothetical protein